MVYMELASVTMCAGCSGCEGNLNDRDLAYELDLEAMMAERPDGNSSPPKHTVNVWHISPISLSVTPRGRGGLGSRHSGVRAHPPMDVARLAQRTLGALEKARE